MRLTRFEDAARLAAIHASGWICYECRTVNRRAIVECVECGKWRWSQLSISPFDVYDLVRRLYG